jgi:PleD family two-component response regulator
VLPEGERLSVTASFGVAELDPAADDKASLIAAADAALYEAERTGRNRTVQAPGAASRGSRSCG